jgi:hypothetical protein
MSTVTASGKRDPFLEDDIPEQWVPDDVPGYLIKKGWKRVPVNISPHPGKRWLDPLTGGKSERRKVGEQILEHGQKRDLYQWFVPNPPWYYNLREAFEIQAQRDGKRP